MMQQTAQIQFRDMEETPSTRKAVEKHIARLERFFPRIIGCQVLVEAPHHHQKKGNPFHIRIDVSVPGKEIIINPQTKNGSAPENFYEALNRSFGAASRALKEYIRIRRGQVKAHGDIPIAQTISQKNDELFY